MTYDFRLISFATPDYDAEIALRTEVLRKPLGLEFDPNDLSKEYTDFHLGAFDNSSNLLACLVMTPVDKKTVKMRQFGVYPSLQGKGIGTLLVGFAEQWAAAEGFEKITLHARKTAVPFYIRLKYSTEGEEFTEVTIPHFSMYKILK